MTAPAAVDWRTDPRWAHGLHAIRWMETFCRFTKLEWVGKPFRLLPWEKRLIVQLLEVRPDAAGRLRRVHRWAYVSVPKKNGKSELTAALAHYLLLGDELNTSPHLAVAAASDRQADVVFGAVRRMAELSPELHAALDVYEGEILAPSRGPAAKIERIAAAVGTNDGPAYTAVLLDELHEWTGAKGEKVWDVLTNGIVAAENPLVFQTTTAGFDPETICGYQYDHARRVLAGDVVDPSYYAFIIEAEPDDDHRDPAVWARVNPSYGVTVREETLRDQLRQKPEAVFRRYFLNQWTESEENAIPPAAWRACHHPEIELDPALPTYVGIDAGRTHDSSAVAIAQARTVEIDGAEVTGVVLRAKIWENPYPFTDSRHDDWTFDLATLEQYLEHEVFPTYPVAAAAEPDSERPAPGPAFYYDPWRLDRSAEVLRGRGLNMIRLDQTDARLGPAAMNLYELVVQARLFHDAGPHAALTRHIAATKRKDVMEGRAWRLVKTRKSAKIDGAIGSSIAAFFAQRAGPPRAVRWTAV